MAHSDQFDVFLSYASNDSAAVEVLAHKLRHEAHLAPFLDRWHIVPGEVWQEGIEEALFASRAVAVFIGPNGLSPWHHEEMRLALDNAVRTHEDFRVIPVLLPNADEANLRGFLANRAWVDFRMGLYDKHAFDRLVAGVLGQPVEVGADFDLPDKPTPYPGLRAFSIDDTSYFFGRSREIDRLHSRLNTHTFTAVLGASGSGKSSLVMAGLLPTLPDAGNWHTLLVQPGTRPLRALAGQLARLQPTDDILTATDKLEKRFTARQDGLISAITTLTDRDMRTLLVIDQFEELFTQLSGDGAHNKTVRRAFILNLLDAVENANGHFHCLITLRVDFIQHCLAFPMLGQLLEKNQLLLSPMTSGDLRTALIKPAQQVGAYFEHGLPGRLLEDMRDQENSAAPLQFMLSQLWLRRHGVWLTHAAQTKRSGGLVGRG